MPINAPETINIALKTLLAAITPRTLIARRARLNHGIQRNDKNTAEHTDGKQINKYPNTAIEAEKLKGGSLH